MKAIKLVTSDIKISNPKNNLEPLVVACLVNTRITHLCIPETYAIQLKLEENEKRLVTLFNGSIHLVSYVGPIKVDWYNRVSFTGTMVMSLSYARRALIANEFIGGDICNISIEPFPGSTLMARIHPAFLAGLFIFNPSGIYLMPY